jgi:hypothetical protein
LFDALGVVLEQGAPITGTLIVATTTKQSLPLLAGVGVFLLRLKEYVGVTEVLFPAESVLLDEFNREMGVEEDSRE